MIRHVFLFNHASFDALPRMERWYRQYHAPETVRKLGPWLTRYISHRAVAPPTDLQALGYYNYRWSEMWFRDFERTEPPSRLTWYDGQMQDFGDTVRDDIYGGAWEGSAEGRHPPVQLFLPAHAEVCLDNHRGIHTPVPAFRWIAVLKFPADRAAGDRWVLDEVLPAFANTPGVTQVLSSAALQVPEEKLRELSPGEPMQFPWHRWMEVQFTEYECWAKCAMAVMTAPTANRIQAGDIQPYSDLTSTIVLEKPDWTLEELRPFP